MELPKPKKIDVERYIGGLAGFKKITNPIKLSANESALGASPKAILAFEKDKNNIFNYPESDSNTLREIISKKFLNLRKNIINHKNIKKFLWQSKKDIEKLFQIKIEYLENRNVKNLKISNRHLGSKIFLSYYFKDIRLIDNF